MHRTQYLLLAILLAFLLLLDPLIIALSLPITPDIARGLAVDQGTGEFNLIALMVGLGVGPIFLGPASDRFGRKPVLLWSLAVVVLASVAIAAVPSFSALIILRLIQGFAASAIPIVASAIVRDKFVRKEAARLLSFALIGVSIGPIVAPILSAAINIAFGWRAVFWRWRHIPRS